MSGPGRVPWWRASVTGLGILAAVLAVIGLGGVGSWAVEALARSGVGHLTLIDLDEICLTRAPLLLGGGIPLFGKTDRQITLENASATAFANDFVQVRYTVNYR